MNQLNVCVFCAIGSSVTKKTKDLVNSMYPSYTDDTIRFFRTGARMSDIETNTTCKVRVGTPNFEQELQVCIGDNVIDVFIFENCPVTSLNAVPTKQDFPINKWGNVFSTLKKYGHHDSKLVFGVLSNRECVYFPMKDIHNLRFEGIHTFTTTAMSAKDCYAYVYTFQPSNNLMMNAGKLRKTYIGPRGGQYVIVKGKKVYI